MTESDIPKVMELARQCEAEAFARHQNIQAARAALLAELQRLASTDGVTHDSFPEVAGG